MPAATPPASSAKQLPSYFIKHMKIQAIRYHERGAPEAVLRADTIDLRAPAEGQVTAALRAAVIHPSDLGMIGGTYGRLPDLPAVGGREGVGEVIAIGEGVQRLKVGDRVRMPENLGVWQQAVTADADSFEKAPSDLPLEMAAMAFINPPTAYRLLHDFIDLKEGDWIVQNAANSAVGFCVAGLASSLGVRTINTVRSVEAWEGPLKQVGADVVVDDASDWFKDLKNLTGGEKPRLGLNSVGGESVVKIIRSLGEGGQCVTFGGMVGDKVRFPTRHLIFDDVALRGFWMDKWARTHSLEERAEFQRTVNELIRRGAFQIPVAAKYELSQFADAVAHAARGSRDGKVLFVSNWGA